MPIDSHPIFMQPDKLAPLWRYMDLAKFASMLTSKSLWLTNAEVLSIEDPHEGTLSNSAFIHRSWSCIEDVPKIIRKKIEKNYKHSKTWDPPKDPFSAFVDMEEQTITMVQIIRRSYFVNCWHLEDIESVAMWKIYGSPGPGIAIISNLEKMKSSLKKAEESILVGKVNYFDERKDSIDYRNGFNLILSKRNSYKYESEVRMVCWKPDLLIPKDGVDVSSFEAVGGRKLSVNKDIISGIKIECDIGALISEIIVSPYAPAWYVETIFDLCCSFGLDGKVRQSKLLDLPASASIALGPSAPSAPPDAAAP